MENTKGERLGSLGNLMIHINTGIFEYAAIEMEAFLGIGRRDTLAG